MSCQLPSGHFGLCCCFLHSEDQYAEPIGAAPLATQRGSAFTWASADPLFEIFQGIGVDVKKAAKLWNRGIRSPAALAALTDSEASSLAGLSADDLVNLEHYRGAPACSASSRPTPLRSDHPVLAPTLRGSRVVAKQALRTPAGRAAALQEIDGLLAAPSAKNNASQRWQTWCELLEPFGERPLPVTAEKVRMVAAGLRAGGFRKAQRYFGAACIEHLRAFGRRPGPLVDFEMTAFARAVSRGIGPAAAKESFVIEDLADSMTPPSLEDIASRSASEPLWPCGTACLGAWWMTRSIELTAAKVEHMMVDPKTLKVHWSLPVSKTDVLALGISRTHRCLCSSHPCLAMVCPFHTAAKYLEILKEKFGHLDYFDEMPLFPNCKGGTLTHSASVKMIRFAAAAAGDALAHSPGRFGEHALRVSGAQFLSRALHMDVYLIQLYGRWASRTVARYVQDAPLARPLPLQAGNQAMVTLDMIAKMVAELIGEKKPLKDALAQVVPCVDEETVLALQVELKSALHPPAMSDGDDAEEALVMNKRTKVAHAVLVGPGPGVSSDDYFARCGWRFGLVSHCFPSTPSDFKKRCQKCFGDETADTALDSEASDSSASD